MKKRVALITWAGLPKGAESEQLLLARLSEAGVGGQMVDWCDPSVDFSKFDLVVLRSCWDYHLHAQEFTDWLQRISKITPVLNAIETVLWNSNKFYLRELEAQDIAIAPTLFVSDGTRLSQDYPVRTESWQQIVVKPAISASAHKTWMFERQNMPSPVKLAELMDGNGFLLQQFIPEIQTQGEISFVYIDGIFSHAALKRPAIGDFRVQQEHGGSSELFHPPDLLLKQANAIAEEVSQVRGSLYCRLDAIEKNGKLILMELELIEPELYLTLAEPPARTFADAIVKRLR